MNAELAERRLSRAALEAELRAAGSQKIKGTSVQCPFHDDQSPSGWICRDESGVWRFQCMTPTCGFRGDVLDVQARREGKQVGDLLALEHKPDPPPRAKRVFPSVDAIVKSVGQLGKVEAHYAYTDPITQRVQIVQVRYRDEGKKKFLTHHAVPGGFVLGAPDKPWPIYNRGRVALADTVVVVEGERCVHALHDIGITATTSLSGSGNADNADWSPLAGKNVFLWRDFDASGARYVEAVADRLQQLPRPPRTIRSLRVEGLGLPDGGDVVDFLAGGGTAEEVWRVLEDGSEAVGPGALLTDRVEDIISGKWRSIEWPWRELSDDAKSLFPGTVTVLCGDPAASKSFLALQAWQFWLENGVSADLLMFEDDRTFHMQRLLAIQCERWDMLNDKWGREHPDEFRELNKLHEEKISSLAPRLHSMEMGVVRYADVLRWVTERCKAGAKVLIVDPITAIEVGDRRHIEDLQFIVQACKVLREHGARLVVVTHPRQSFGTKRTTMDDIAGGRAWSRHTQTVLLLHRHDPAKKFMCKTPLGDAPFVCNRSLTIAKARNAPGNGWKIGFNLGPDVRLREFGVIVNEIKNGEGVE